MKRGGKKKKQEGIQLEVKFLSDMPFPARGRKETNCGFGTFSDDERKEKTRENVLTPD